MPDMKTLTMAGKTYVVCDEIARTAAEEAKEMAGTGSGIVAAVGVMEVDADGIVSIENQYTPVDPEYAENLIDAHNTDTAAHADIRALATNAQSTADTAKTNAAAAQTTANNAATAAANAQTSADSKAPQYSYGTEDLTAGTSALETGKLHFVYE